MKTHESCREHLTTFDGCDPPRLVFDYIVLVTIIWRFPKMEVSPNSWFIMDNSINMDDLEVPPFQEMSMWAMGFLVFSHQTCGDIELIDDTDGWLISSNSSRIETNSNQYRLVVSHIFYFPFHIWDVILPIDELIFFRGVQTTNQMGNSRILKWR